MREKFSCFVSALEIFETSVDNEHSAGGYFGLLHVCECIAVDIMIIACVCACVCREDLGFKVMCEQVSHHPPVSAFHAESPIFTLHGSVSPKIRFWGKSIEITPKGTLTLHLLK